MTSRAQRIAAVLLAAEALALSGCTGAAPKLSDAFLGFCPHNIEDLDAAREAAVKGGWQQFYARGAEDAVDGGKMRRLASWGFHKSYLGAERFLILGEEVHFWPDRKNTIVNVCGMGAAPDPESISRLQGWAKDAGPERWDRGVLSYQFVDDQGAKTPVAAEDNWLRHNRGRDLDMSANFRGKTLVTLAAVVN